MLSVEFNILICFVSRHHSEEVQKKSKKMHDSARKTYQAELDHLKQRNSEQKLRIDVLNQQVGLFTFASFCNAQLL